MKIGDLLYDKHNGNFAIIVHTDNDIDFDVYWYEAKFSIKKIHYSRIMESWREAQKLKPR